MTSESGTVMGKLRGWREYMAPTLKKTAFLERGVLTPEEFVRAGDELVFRCPAWSWERGTNPPKSYLPEDKQFLVTRNVPCPTRVSDMEAQLGLIQQQAQNNDDDDDDWLVSTLVKQHPSSLEDEFDILDEEGEVVKSCPNEEEEKPAEEEGDEYADMADYEDKNVLVDDDAAAPATAGDTNLLKVRTYDLSITYDKYYQTPRVWMVGRSAEGQPLTGKEMMEDVMTDYANKTVTIEVHPHVSGPHASIHPCKHGKVMKTIVDNLMAAQQQTDGNEEAGPSIEMYLFIFLKFVSSIIPTIAYDFTMEVNTGMK
ncbi:ubiquitin-like-conjugating enzyme ATG3 [Fistulifera solaris]|uniref:Ubiquitin-like-conjugating enzyme ATG3 n=1 Tax=Fistulifera solaris TaxID=1519565 RepID=A0A1Z5J895_FISSO|nr:ubiquitin-like-conjugating enzyme ATG3 [Fistulifera solaris]|eukprot:GAX10210.1 ubiquitin-like-conjugating enzyme ATG3 [Fistulifera solaris]